MLQSNSVQLYDDGKVSRCRSFSGAKTFFIVAVIGALIAISVRTQIIVTETSLDDLITVILKAIRNDPGLGSLLHDLVLPTTVNIKVFQISKITIKGLDNFHNDNNTRLTYANNLITAFMNMGIENVSLEMAYSYNLFFFSNSGTLVAMIDSVAIEAALQVPTVQGQQLKITKMDITRLSNYRLIGAGFLNSILNADFLKNIIISTISSQGMTMGNKALEKIKLPWKDPKELPIQTTGYYLY